MDKIGTKKALGIITCDRPEYYEQILESTPLVDIDKVYVFDSSPNNKYALSNDKVELVPHDGGATVGFAKNRLLEKMKEDGFDHLFLQEGDVKLLDGDVFDAYIETAKASGIWGSLNYAWHGNGNKDTNGGRIIKNSIDLDDGLGVDFTHNGTAAFSYIHSRIVDVVGYHDEYYHNCWEHLDFYQAQASLKLSNYWWWFTDIKDSHRYIEDLDDGSHGGSVIRKDDNWKKTMMDGQKHFHKKYGYTPTNMPHATEQQVLERAEFLIERYGKK
jgi:hypothetical protein